MISDLGTAELCLASYVASESDTQGFDHFDAGRDDGVCWAIKHFDDCDVIVLRGSVTGQDWVKDVFAVPYIGHRRNLGKVHHGFYVGLDNAWDDMAQKLRPHLPIVLTGHSLGAARAALLAGIMLDEGLMPFARVVFGEPKAGFQQLADFLKPVSTRSYRCGDGINHDPIPALPATVPPWLYVHQTPLIDITAHADPADYGPFVFHHMPLYAAALAALEA